MLPNTDNIITQLVALGHTEGTVDDRLFAFLKTANPDTAGGINDLLFIYLGQLGYVNTLPDRIKQWVDAGAVLAVDYSPADLFAAGEKGYWYDPSDFSTMFQDAAGTIPVTAAGQPIGKLLDKSGNGNHLTAAGTARPTLEQDGNGFYYIKGDGIDAGLATTGNMETGSSTKATVWTAFDRDASGLGWIVSLSANAAANIGAFAHYIYSSGTFESVVTGDRSCTGTVTSAGDGPNLVTNQLDITVGDVAATANVLRINGAAVTPTYNRSPNAGTFIAAPFYLLSDNGSFPADAKVYPCIGRFAESTAQEIEDTEAWINARMGAF